MTIVKPKKEFKSLPGSFTLIDETHPKVHVRKLYKYMDLETALICLSKKTIRLVQPSEWQDKYERHFYNGDYSNITTDHNIIPKLWACCFTTCKMSEASWSRYRYGKLGLGNHCVKFQISRSEFRKYLRKDKRIKFTFEGLMDYSVSDYDIQHLHLKSSHLYDICFGLPFSIEQYLSLLLLKRSAFNYENEFRFMVTQKNVNALEKYIFINIEWRNLIESVEVDKDMTDTEMDVLKIYLKNAGVQQKVIDACTRVKLYDDPIDKIKIE